MNDVIDVAVDSKNDLKHSEGNIVLKQEQLLAVRELLNVKEVLTVLPTGFGKSTAFTVFNFAKCELLKQTGHEKATSRELSFTL